MKSQKWLEKSFGFDLRSLALFRITLSLVLLFDLINRLADLTAHYTDMGVLPRRVVIEHLGEWNLSLHMLSGTATFQIIIFLVAIVSALCLLLGYKTKLFTIVSWILVISLQNRNPLICYGGDAVMRMLLFWSMFLPLNRYFSVDNRHGKLDTSPHIISFATVAFVLQICFIYFFTVLLKSGPEWRTDFTAVYYALSIDELHTVFTKYLLDSNTLFLKILTCGVLVFEALGPLLLIMPNIKLKLIGLSGFILMHIGFGLFLTLGIFPAISICSFIPFLPSIFWDFRSKKIKTKNREELKIYYDKDCGMCDNFVHGFKSLFLIRETQLIPGQTDNTIMRKMEDKNSWIVESKGVTFFRFRGFIEVVSHSPILWPLKYLLILSPIKYIGNLIYIQVAKRRQRNCPIVFQNKLSVKKPNNFKNGLILFCICTVLIINLKTLYGQKVIIPKTLQTISKAFELTQNWGMFSPRPYTIDGWYVIIGETAKGEKIDLFRKNPTISWEKPNMISQDYKNSRWSKYFRVIRKKSNQKFIQNYARYLMFHWNKENKNSIVNKLDIYFMAEKNTLTNNIPETKKVHLWTLSRK